MPVPVPTPENREPRRLLRDVVYEKMYAAILDGTLELGERLNDDELVRWLGVSRTPVREAIARLAEYGLVEIEANRYTRVVRPSFDQFVDIVVTSYEVITLIVRRGVPALDESQRENVAKRFERRAADARAGEGEDLDNFTAILSTLIEAAQSTMLERVSAVSVPLSVLLFRRAAGHDLYPRDISVTFNTALAAAVRSGDADRAGDLVAEQPELLGAYFDAVRADGIFPG